MQLNRRIRSEHAEAENEKLIASIQGELIIQLAFGAVVGQKTGTLHISDAAVYAQYGGFTGGKYILRLPIRDLVKFGVGKPHRTRGVRTTVPIFFETHSKRVTAEVRQGLGVSIGAFVSAMAALDRPHDRSTEDETMSTPRTPDHEDAPPPAGAAPREASSTEVTLAEFSAAWPVVVARVRSDFSARRHAIVRVAEPESVSAGVAVLTLPAHQHFQVEQLNADDQLLRALETITEEVLGSTITLRFRSADESTPIQADTCDPSLTPRQTRGAATSTEPSDERLLDPAIRRTHPSSKHEHSVAIARGVIDPQRPHSDPYSGMKFNGEIHLSDAAVYFVYGADVFPQPRVVRLARDDLRDWKHAERDGVLGIEFATKDHRLSAMLRRSADSDPDALVDFGRSIEGNDLLFDGVAAFTFVFDWEKRRAPHGEEQAQAAAETVARVRDAEPGVFVDIATRLAAAAAENRVPPAGGSVEMGRFMDEIVESSGYVEARARVMDS